MKIKYLFFGLIILAIQGCGLKVQRNIVLRDLPMQDTSLPISIYVDTNNIPQNTKVIGSLFIGDGGSTVKCDSATVFNRARVETRKVGGNALLLTDYRKPSIFGSTCHQIRGMMLYVPASTSPENNDDVIVAGLSSAEEITTSQTPTTIKEDINKVAAKSKERKLDIAAFRADLGYSWRLAKIPADMDPFDKHITEKIHSGLAWSLSADYFFNDNYGIGFSAYQYNSAFDILATNYETGASGILDSRSSITFIGPKFVGRDALDKNNSWILYGSVGIGYIGYEIKQTFLQDYYKESGSFVGFQYGLGLDHKLNDNWAIGAGLLLTAGLVTTVEIDRNGYKETYKTDNVDEGVGLGQFAIKAGIRYFINPPKKKGALQLDEMK